MIVVDARFLMSGNQKNWATQSSNDATVNAICKFNSTLYRQLISFKSNKICQQKPHKFKDRSK